MITKERQSDSVGYIYKTTHVPSGRFYIGESTILDEKKMNAYYGSGYILAKLLVKYPLSEFTKEYLFWSTEKEELYELEVIEIKNVIDNDLNINVKISKQGELPICAHCGGRGTHFKECKYAPKCEFCGSRSTSKHRRDCPLFKAPSGWECEFCGKTSYNHTIDCPNYIPPKECKHCGSKSIHKEGCPNYIPPGICDECGGKRNHHSTNCSKHKFYPESVCNECGGRAYQHLKTCSKYKVPKEPEPCEECNTKNGMHYKWCSRYKERKTCTQCNGKNGMHYKKCSHYNRTSSKYKIKIVCEECTGKNNVHYKECSRYKPRKKSKPCEECKGKCGQHFKTCPKYKSNLKSKGELNNV